MISKYHNRCSIDEYANYFVLTNDYEEGYFVPFLEYSNTNCEVVRVIFVSKILNIVIRLQLFVRDPLNKPIKNVF